MYKIRDWIANTNFKSHEVNVSEEINDYSKTRLSANAHPAALDTLGEPRQNKLENTVEQQI
jgi:hypothetical protein